MLCLAPGEQFQPAPEDCFGLHLKGFEGAEERLAPVTHSRTKQPRTVLLPSPIRWHWLPIWWGCIRQLHRILVQEHEAFCQQGSGFVILKHGTEWFRQIFVPVKPWMAATGEGF